MAFLITYVLFIKTEKFESFSTVIVKDLEQEQSTSPLGAMLLSSSTEAAQDAMLLDVYMKSSDMFDLLDKEYNLTAYYASEDIDFFSRLNKDTFFIYKELNQINLLNKYNNDLTLFFDEMSSTLSIRFLHANPKIAQKIVQSMIQHATVMLNEMQKKSSEIVLDFLKKLEKEKYELFLTSLKKLLVYQNQHNSIDPKTDVEVQSSILAKLEGELIQKEVAYQSKLQYMNAKAAEMKLLKSNIEYIKSNIKKVKTKLTGQNEHSVQLNKELADFQLLKSQVEFNKEIYYQTLVKLEESAIMVSQNTKNLIIVSSPKVADSYAQPNKFKDIVTIIILLSLLYGITGLVSSIIRDHRD